METSKSLSGDGLDLGYMHRRVRKELKDKLLEMYIYTRGSEEKNAHRW